MTGRQEGQRRERSIADYQSRLVVFDTNVVECRYLAPLLRGEACRDLARLRDHAPAYSPAIFVKSYFEICQHVKKGTKTFPWCSSSYGYPGGLDTGRAILRRSDSQFQENNLYWWFNIAEEWRGRDWERYQAEMLTLTAPSAREAIIEELRTQREFATWKFSLSAFCQRIWSALEREFTILTQHDVQGFDGEYLDEVFQLEQELAERCLVPSEDFELVTAALACRASAFVTNEKEMLRQTAFAVDLNWKTAFVHADRLIEALDDDFMFRNYGPPTRGRPDG